MITEEPVLLPPNPWIKNIKCLFSDVYFNKNFYSTGESIIFILIFEKVIYNL